MKLVVAIAAAALSVPAFAQAPAATTADGGLPVCSKTVTDRCVQGPAARRAEASAFNPKMLGRDYSAQLTPKQAEAGMKTP